MRFSFTYHFLIGAETMRDLAAAIDQKGDTASEEEKAQHLGYIAGSIMQSVAALESEAWNMYHNGLGSHLGSNGIDAEASEKLKVFAEDVDRMQLIPRYDFASKLARGVCLDKGSTIIQNLDLLIKLRNEITHYKSLNSEDYETRLLFQSLEKKTVAPPSFFSQKGGNFFPLLCLSHGRATWALKTSVDFLEDFYLKLCILSPLAAYRKFRFS
jgi:hypothetical protein